MAIELTKRPNRPIILNAFPGFGLVGTITTEFLIRHLNCEMIGRKWFEDLPAAVAIHQGNIVQPIGLYYNEEYNLVIVHSIAGAPGIEWKIADYLEELGDELNAVEFISLDGIGTLGEKEVPEIFYYASNPDRGNDFEGFNLKKLTEGVVMGVTSAHILKTKRQTNAFFVETHSEFPDSKAAAELIKALDKILNLKVDPEPLYESAKQFEDNFNKLLEQGKVSQNELKKKQFNYVG